ncbi:MULTISPECIES: DUF302 domain-containing protein [Gordonia]|uniref:DUF302 domain-containing protein n=1 Tax=Gordonia amicalis TaxID=89053 RepID=A0AAE4U800_9ACTN|nr:MULTISPECIES: DUF302 domain-containing protein [Gordonia]MBA5849384.1 DUF302 domain-containing protein [Gordonia amicalis]MCZ4579227.1 DUF302 domain-containing protein [Gordonia amicalis]MDJ0452394.1 DUF302 domain-containing protein [Gordonia amicalis]MDV6306406.1 DUF302 domain-containing protein [Gordonia amicalis]MDV6311836.1 DUF302 domain-containing protein [Gordonia amicalis]
MSLALNTTLAVPFDEAVERTRAALADQGFGVLTEIDVQATMKKKLDEDMEQYLILGACNPPLANRALGVQRQIGLLLPCNVVVRSDPDHPGTTLVEAMNPDLMVQVSGEPELESVARDAATKLQAAIDALSNQS